MPVIPCLSRPFLGMLAVLGALAASPSQADAHAAFVGSSPTPGARTEAAPRDVVLRFTEPLNRRLTAIRLVAVRSGDHVGASHRSAGSARVLLRPRRPLATGAYRVKWHTVSTQDGHALEGTFSFGVRASAVGTANSVEESPLARDGWIRVVMRVLLYATSLLFIAALLLAQLLGGQGSWLAPDTLREDGGSAQQRGRVVTESAGWLAVAAAVGATLAEAADAAGSLSPGALGDYLLANEAGGARLAVVGLLTMAAISWQRLPRAAAIIGVLALGAMAASGHASSASPRLLSLFNDWLHLLAAAAWLGGIGLLALVWAGPLRRAGPALRADVARHVLMPFGVVALPAFLLVGATGLVSLFVQLGHLSALWRTDYGRLLAVKIGVVGVIASIGAVHAWRLRPRMLTGVPRGERDRDRHWRLVRSEPLLGLGVVAAVGLLAVFPLPPRQLGAADAVRTATSTCDPCPLPRPAARELPIAAQAGSHLVAAWIRRTRTEVTGTLRVADLRGRPASTPLSSDDARLTTCGTGCGRFRTKPEATSLEITLRERNRSYTVSLPTRWLSQDNGRARRLLLAAQTAMRELRSVRQVDAVTSGPGTFATTEYRSQAPDRMRFRTNGGVQAVITGRRQWLRTRGTPWQLTEYGSGLPFRTRNWFRWSTYGRSVRLLGERRTDGRRIAEIALFDEGTPVWFRLTIDLASLRVVREEMSARAHFMTSRFSAFNAPATIEPPVMPNGR